MAGTRFHHVNSYAATPEQVLAMVTSAEFRKAVCEHQHALSYDVEVTSQGDTVVVSVARTQAMEGAPAAARKVVGDTVHIVQRESWRAGSTGAADFSVEIPGKPGRLTGTITLQDRGDGRCDELYAGEVKVNIPLVGGKLEGFIADILGRALRREGAVGEQWLARGTDG